jgi:para-nitrobenzyl esterase
LARWQPGTVYGYRLEWDYLLPASHIDNILLGATHGLDVVFVFGRDNLGPEFLHIPLISEKHARSYRALSEAIMSYWTQFAAQGDPAGGRYCNLPQWRAWSAAQATSYFVLDDSEKGGLRMASTILRKNEILKELAEDPEITSNDERCLFLRELYRIAGRFSLFTDQDYACFSNGYCAERYPL